MHIVGIPKIIPAIELSALTSALTRASFVSGKATANVSAKRIKNNLQLPAESELARDGAQRLLALVLANASFRAATLPIAFTTPRFCRYEAGMGYGDHRDMPIMAGTQPIRTDLAITVSLTSAQGYAGGELVIESDGAAQRWKGDAGDCIVYPANTRHRVETVTQGVRLVAILWIQSAVRDPSKRRLLFEMANELDALALKCPEASDELGRLRECHANLVRTWAET